MDAVTERRAAALTGPVAAPVRAGSSCPGGTRTSRRPRPAACPARRSRAAPWARRAPDPCRCWKTTYDGAPRSPLGGGEQVQVGQRRGRRLLEQHRATGLEQLRRDLGVGAGRGGDADQVGAPLAHQAAYVGKGRPAVVVGVRLGVLGHDVDQADQLGAARRRVRLGVLVGDPSAPDDGDPEIRCFGRATRHGAIMPRDARSLWAPRPRPLRGTGTGSDRSRPSSSRATREDRPRSCGGSPRWGH